jgi:nitrogen fixation protein FixH
MMREITGRHVLVVTVSAFALIIGVNVLMAYKAISTFPGLEVANSYVASQSFDEDRRAQVALGWSVAQGYVDGQISLKFTDSAGKPVVVQDLAVLVGRTTEAAEDSRPAFIYQDGAYVAAAALHPGKWMLHVSAKSGDGVVFQQRLNLFVKG